MELEVTVGQVARLNNHGTGHDKYQPIWATYRTWPSASGSFVLAGRPGQPAAPPSRSWEIKNSS